MLADLLLHDGQPAEALAVVAGCEDAAASKGYQKERCWLLADRALAQTALEAPTAEIEATLAALRAACKATGSTRIEAETMRDLARRLQPRASVPDRLALAEEAMTLFSAMPMPIEAALCMELQGDTLAARGLEAEAHSRYRAAAASLERRGVALWRARLGAKIEATGRA